MKAIEILFLKIDELNTQLQSQENVFLKAQIAYEMKAITEIICNIAENARWSDNDNAYL